MEGTMIQRIDNVLYTVHVRPTKTAKGDYDTKLKNGFVRYPFHHEKEEWDDCFVEALQRINQTEYYLDELWEADWPEREIIMNDLQNDIERIAKKS